MVEKRIHLLAYPLVSLTGGDVARQAADGEKRRTSKDVRGDEK